MYCTFNTVGVFYVFQTCFFFDFCSWGHVLLSSLWPTLALPLRTVYSMCLMWLQWFCALSHADKLLSLIEASSEEMLSPLKSKMNQSQPASFFSWSSAVDAINHQFSRRELVRPGWTNPSSVCYCFLPLSKNQVNVDQYTERIFDVLWRKGHKGILWLKSVFFLR